MYEIRRLYYLKAFCPEDFDKYCQLVDIFDTHFTSNLHFQYLDGGSKNIFFKNL